MEPKWWSLNFDLVEERRVHPKYIFLPKGKSSKLMSYKILIKLDCKCTWSWPTQLQPCKDRYIWHAFSFDLDKNLRQSIVDYLKFEIVNLGYFSTCFLINVITSIWVLDLKFTTFVALKWSPSRGLQIKGGQLVIMHSNEVMNYSTFPYCWLPFDLLCTYSFIFSI